LDLTTAFRRFAAESREASPLYAELATIVARTPALAAPLEAAPSAFRTPSLMFAAMQYVLRTAHHPLAAYLPTLGGFTGADDALETRFRQVMTENADAIASVCAHRPLQTNEVSRCAALRPAFGIAAGLDQRPLALLEMGAGAGLLLYPDWYAYRYLAPRGRLGTWRCGNPDTPPRLRIDAELEGGAVPEGLSREPVIARRIGIDLAPLDVADEKDVDWLRACVWPEHVLRLARLEAAVAQARQNPVTLIAGDMVAMLPRALAMIDDACVPCVFASDALEYLSADQRVRLTEALHRAGATRDLVVIAHETVTAGAALFTDEAGRYAQAGDPQAGVLVMVRFSRGEATVRLLARTRGYGRLIDWDPVPAGYSPKSRLPSDLPRRTIR
jgi:hypothetical protein